MIKQVVTREGFSVSNGSTVQWKGPSIILILENGTILERSYDEAYNEWKDITPPEELMRDD